MLMSLGLRAMVKGHLDCEGHLFLILILINNDQEPNVKCNIFCTTFRTWKLKNLKLLLSGHMNTISVLNAEWTIENRKKRT